MYLFYNEWQQSVKNKEKFLLIIFILNLLWIVSVCEFHHGKMNLSNWWVEQMNLLELIFRSINWLNLVTPTICDIKILASYDASIYSSLQLKTQRRKTILRMPPIRSILILVIITVLWTIPQADAECCRKPLVGKWGKDPTCGDQHVGESSFCCGVGTCNIFCCNCEGGCIPGSFLYDPNDVNSKW